MRLYTEEVYTERPTHLVIRREEITGKWLIWGEDRNSITEEYWTFHTHAEAVHAIPIFVQTTTLYNHYKWDWRAVH